MAIPRVEHGLAEPARQIASNDRGVQGQAMTRDDGNHESARHFSGHAQI
jgi:hypothetical protein